MGQAEPGPPQIPGMISTTVAAAFVLGAVILGLAAGGLVGFWVSDGSKVPAADRATIVSGSLSTISQMLSKLADVATEKHNQRNLSIYSDMAAIFAAAARINSFAGQEMTVCHNTNRPYPFNTTTLIFDDWNRTCSAYQNITGDTSANQIVSTLPKYAGDFNDLMWNLIEMDNHLHSDP